jgi:hypothetical protein
LDLRHGPLDLRPETKMETRRKEKKEKERFLLFIWKGKTN